MTEDANGTSLSDEDKVIVEPWAVLDYPPENPRTSAELSYLFTMLSQRPDDEAEDAAYVENALVEYQLSEWWIAECAREAAQNGTSMESTLPWGSIQLYRFPDNDTELAAQELDEPGYMRKWLQLVGSHNALLFFQLHDLSPMTNERGNEKRIFVWGLAERVSIEKASKAPDDSETIAPYIHKSTVPIHPPLQTASSFIYVQGGRDRWIYPLVTCNPAEYGPRENAAMEELDQNHVKYGHIPPRFGALIRRLIEIESKWMRNNCKTDQEEESMRRAYESCVREHYLRYLELTDPVVRIVDWRMRKLLFFYTLSTKDMFLRSVLENVGAKVIEVMVNIGWPEERHVRYLAKRARRDDYRIDFAKFAHILRGSAPTDERQQPPPLINGHQVMPAASAFPVALPSKLLLSVRHPRIDISEVCPFMMLPGDTIEELEKRFSMIIARLRRTKVTFVFDTDDDIDKEWTRDPNFVVSRRYKGDSMRNLVVVSKTHDPCSWRLAPFDQQTDEDMGNPDSQSIFDEFPTRVFFLFKKDARDVRMQARRALVIVMRTIHSNAKADGNSKVNSIWTQKSASEAERWQEAMIVHETEAYTVVVFPYVVVSTLASLRDLCAPMKQGFHSHFYVDRSPIALPPNHPDRVLQPSLEQLGALLLQSKMPDARVPSEPATVRLAFDNSRPFNNKQLEDAVVATAQRFSDEDQKPTVAWVRPEASFLVNPPEESPDKRGIAPVVGDSDDIVTRTGRVSCEGRLVTWRDYGYWLGSEFRLLVRSETQRLDGEYAGDAGRCLRHRHKIEQDQIDQIRAMFLPPESGDSKGSGRGIRRGLRSSLNSSGVIVLDEETDDGAMTRHRTVDVDEKERKQAHAARDAKEKARQDHARFKSRMRPLPGGSKEERDKWLSFAETRPEEWLNHVFNRDMENDPKSSIKITDESANGLPKFFWRDYKNENFAGAGAYNLALYAYFIENIGESMLYKLRRAKEERSEFEKAKKEGTLPEDSDVEVPPRWTDVAQEMINQRLFEAFLRDEEKSPGKGVAQTLYGHVMQQAHTFYSRYHTTAGQLLSEARLASRGVARKKASPEKLEQDRKQLATWYHESVPIDGFSAQKYLRDTRGLKEISKDILENSPYVRYHSKFPYSVKQRHEDGASSSTLNFMPALLCFCYNEEKQIYVTVQAIHLNERTNTKAEFAEPKLNPSKKSHGSMRDEYSSFLVQPGRKQTRWIFLCEGPETAWSVASASRYLRVYCSFGVGNFWRFSAHKDTAAGVVICMDRDKNKRTHKATMSIIASATERLKKAGWKNVAGVIPDCDDGCKDFNDVHRNHGIDALRRMLKIPEELRTCDVLPDGVSGQAEWDSISKE